MFRNISTIFSVHELSTVYVGKVFALQDVKAFIFTMQIKKNNVKLYL